jgi:hypothetical protein
MSKTFRVLLPKLVEFVETEIHYIEAETAEEAMSIVRDSYGDPRVQYEASDHETKEVWYHDMTATEANG